MARRNEDKNSWFPTWLRWGNAGGSLNPPANRRQRIKAATRLTPEQSQQPFDLETAQNFCHDLFINSSVARAVSRAFKVGVLGGGLELRSLVKNKTKNRKTKLQGLNEPVNLAIEKAWAKWGRCVTVDGELSWNKATRKVLQTIIESGEAYIRFFDVVPLNPQKGVVEDEDSIPLSFQILEGDMLDTSYKGVVTGDDYWLEGVKYDKFNRPLAYGFKVIVRGVYDTLEIEASKVLHLYVEDETRPNARRGWPWLTNVMYAIDRLETFMSTQLTYAENNAAVCTWLSQSTVGGPLSTSALAGGGDEELDIDIQDVVEAGNKGGGVRLLPPGYAVTERQQQAATQMVPFYETSLKQIAHSVGITYEVLFLEFGTSNFSSARLSGLYNSQRFTEIRKMFTEDFHDVVFKKWLSLYLLKDSSLERVSASVDDYEHTWEHQRMPYTEPDKAFKAAELANNMQVASLSTIAKDNGLNFEAEAAQMARDKMVLEGLGLLETKIEPEEPTVSDDEQQAGPPSSDNPEEGAGDEGV